MAASAPLQEVIPTFDMAVNELFFERFPDSVLEHQIQVRPYNAIKTRNMRGLNPEGENTTTHPPNTPQPHTPKNQNRSTRNMHASLTHLHLNHAQTSIS